MPIVWRIWSWVIVPARFRRVLAEGGESTSSWVMYGDVVLVEKSTSKRFVVAGGDVVGV